MGKFIFLEICERLLVRSVLLAKELDRVDIKNTCKLLQHVDRGCVLLSFEHTDIVAIDVCTVGELLLG